MLPLWQWLWFFNCTSSNTWHIIVWYFNQAWRSVGHVWYKFSTRGISLCDISTKLGGLWVMSGTSSQHTAYHCVIFQPSLEVCGSCLVQVLTCGISLCDISTKLGGLWVMSGTSSNMWHITVWYFNQAWRSVGHVWYKLSAPQIQPFCLTLCAL